MADSSRTRIIYRVETAFAEAPPTNAATTRLRFTSESLDHKNKVVVSEEIRPDRQRSDNALVGYDAGGDITQELVYGGFFETALQAALGGTWATDIVRNGTTNRSFGIEKGFLDKNIFLYMRGSVLNRLALDITAGRLAQFTTSWMSAQGYIAGTSAAGTTTPTEPVTNNPIPSGDLIALLDAGGTNVDLSGEKVRRIAFTIDNNLRMRDLATAYQTDDFGRGSQAITGTFETYLNGTTIYTALKANALVELKFSVTDPILTVNNTYEFTFPRVKLSTAPTPISGVDADVMQPVAWQAFYDSTVGYTMSVERNVG